ncbi:MAG TPA: hypothetical protein DDX81_08455 [Desulfofustis sp.]|jgi:hypothetical protein|nr:hypothetical protein [Desulfofustis sp.]
MGDEVSFFKVFRSHEAFGNAGGVLGMYKAPGMIGVEELQLASRSFHGHGQWSDLFFKARALIHGYGAPPSLFIWG